MGILQFTQVHDASERPILQADGVKIILPDKSEVYANKAYLNKLFKNSGYYGVTTVDRVYNIVGDTTSMDEVDLGQDNVLVTDGEDNFIYINKNTYLNLSQILDSIKRVGSNRRVLGDTTDLTHAIVIFEVGRQEYVFEMNLDREWANLYEASHKSDNKLHPNLVASCNLFEETAAGTIIDSIVDKDAPCDRLVPATKELFVSELVYLLEATGLIKYNGRKKMHVARTSNEEVLGKLVDYLEVINGTKWKFRFLKKSGYLLGQVEEDINNWYQKVLFEVEDVPFDVTRYLWSYSRFGKVLEEDE